MKTTDLIKDSLNHSSRRRGFLLIPLALALAWKSFHGKNIQSPRLSLGWAFLRSAAILTLLLATANSSFAGSATWSASPATGNWSTAGNWTPATVPNGPNDTATFATSNIRFVAPEGATQVNGIVFNPGASRFTIALLTTTLTISGVGITNNSGITQNFAPGPGAIDFMNSATAGGSNVAFTDAGTVQFFNTSTAGDATFTNNGAVKFFDTSTPTADNGTFTNTGGAVSGGGGGFIIFNAGTAGDATFTNNGGAVSGAFPGETLFNPGDAGDATLIANGGLGGGDGGLIVFSSAGGVSTGGTARVEVFGNGNLDISQQSAPGLTTGSIEGDGLVFLGANNLTVGTNNLSTTFSGLVQDGGISRRTGGSLTKTGNGKLSLTNANTYTGATTVNAGSLLVKNRTGSGTGTGAVQVNAGTLGGTGKINGAVTVGTGTSSGAILLAGNSATSPGTLTINNTLTFNSLSTYKCVLNRTRAKASEAAALGMTINSNVPFTFVDTGTGTLATGTVFTVINNTSANPIFGTFSNLSDGSVFTSNGNNFQASYTGGTGNDLTLTVVP